MNRKRQTLTPLKAEKQASKYDITRWKVGNEILYFEIVLRCPISWNIII